LESSVVCLILLFAVRDIYGADSKVVVDVSHNISRTSSDFICFTMDWWPPDKCDYGRCAWGNASIINQNLHHPILAKAIRAISPVLLRLGGSLEDHIVYNVGNPPVCKPITLDPNDRLGFDGGCFEMKRWDEINALCNVATTGCRLVFGLNNLYGRQKVPGCNRTWCDYTGNWDSSNSKNFLEYTAKANHNIFGIELGNELSGPAGVTAHLTPQASAQDYKILRALIDIIWPNNITRPLLIGTDSFFDVDWFTEFLNLNPGVDVITHHIYSLGPGVDPNLNLKIMNPFYLDELKTIALGAQRVIQAQPKPQELWIGEAGGAYNSGQHLVTDAFISGFWYLDQIANFAVFGHQRYCRQTLIGGNYGFLNTTTLHPNPDYYNALLWRRLMGERVLKVVGDTSTPYLRAYGHCKKDNNPRGSVTVLLLNLHPATSYTINLTTQTGVTYSGPREEYILTAPGNNIYAQQTQLNGKLLELTPDEDIPQLVPVRKLGSEPLVIAPLSYGFVVLLDIAAPTCV